MYKENVLYTHNGIVFTLKKILPLVIAWMNLEDVMLSEISQYGRT